MCDEKIKSPQPNTIPRGTAVQQIKLAQKIFNKEQRENQTKTQDTDN